MLRAVLVEEKRRKMQMPLKATWEYYCSTGKTVKASGQSCNIYIGVLRGGPREPCPPPPPS